MLSKTEMLDICTSWIEDRDASYIAKDDIVVWFASWTGQDSDKAWHSMTLSESVRAVKYVWMSADQPLTSSILIQAFQELDEVYEVAIHSELEVIGKVFNYSAHSPRTIQEEIISKMVTTLREEKFLGLHMDYVNLIFEHIAISLNVPLISNTARNKFYRKHFIKNGYLLREGKNRAFKNGQKLTAMLDKDSKGEVIKDLEHSERLKIARIVHTKLK